MEYQDRLTPYCHELVVGSIKVSDIPDEFFVDVTERVKYDLPVPVMHEVIQRLEALVAGRKYDLAKIEDQLAAIENDIRDAESKRAEIRKQIR